MSRNFRSLDRKAERYRDVRVTCPKCGATDMHLVAIYRQHTKCYDCSTVIQIAPQRRRQWLKTKK
jgi:hypothetical protein